jgi:hypothetical protein
MTSYVGNNIYLTIGGIVVHGLYKKVNLDPTTDTVDVTRGSGTNHMQREAGMRDTKMGITVGYETTQIQTQLQYLLPGRYTVVFGPEGNTPGKPKHQQDFILTGAPLEIDVSKKEVAFDIKLEGADAATADMYAGATF